MVRQNEPAARGCIIILRLRRYRGQPLPLLAIERRSGCWFRLRRVLQSPALEPVDLSNGLAVLIDDGQISENLVLGLVHAAHTTAQRIGGRPIPSQTRDPDRKDDGP